ncbi:claudin-6 precursor [Camelus ferus]|nr:claudin-6 precursor [Camelus ferus]
MWFVVHRWQHHQSLLLPHTLTAHFLAVQLLNLHLTVALAGLQILGIVLSLLGWVNALVSWCPAPVESDCLHRQQHRGGPGGPAGCPSPQHHHSLMALLGFLIYLAGAKCTTCVMDKDSKAQLVLTSGIIFVISGIWTLIPVCWTANTIIRDFYNPLVAEAQKWELGASLYVGWGASGLLLLGGELLCCTCPSWGSQGSSNYMAQYSASAPHTTSWGP